MGGTATPAQQAATTAYSTTFTLNDTWNKSLTMQGGLPQRDGTVQSHSVLGAKIISAEFSCRVGELLTCSLEFDGKNLTTAQSLATASFVSGLLGWAWNTSSVKIGAFSSETAVNGVRGWSVRFERPHDTESYTLSGGASKAQQVLNGFTKITGSLEVDLLDTAHLTSFQNVTAQSMVILFEGATNSAGTGYKDTFNITLPEFRFSDFDAPVQGAETLKQTLPFEAKFDGTNAPRIITINKDTTL
jgi:hypothetical protein